MENHTIVTLKKGEGRTIKAGGAWIFDNEIDTIVGTFTNGDVVTVHDFDGYPMGKGFINQNSKIRIRMLTRHVDQEINENFLRMRVKNAWEYRKTTVDTSSCRVIFGEADFLPGLVVDKYEDVLVVECLTLGMEQFKETIVSLLKGVLKEDETKAGVVMGSVHPVMMFFMNGGSVSVVALGAVLASRGTSKPETVIAFMQYFTQISMAMMAVTRMFVMYTKCAASANRISEVLNSKEDITVKAKSEFPDKNTNSHIVFENVNFSYNGKRNNLEGISFELKKGESLGVIGATGSGKTTLVKLLLRFYDTDSGNIYIGGENIRTIEKNRFYEKFGSSLQQDFLHADTIEENIKFGRDISFEDVKRAAQIAQADSFITDFADGYGHILSQHGTNISGGQKQRVLISRALAKKPEILILDDSSSALDYKTDASLRNALRDNMKDTTVVTVAQRVSSVKDCDLILVLDEGKIIGKGTHEYLLENCSEYKEISYSQMGGAFVE